MPEIGAFGSMDGMSAMDFVYQNLAANRRQNTFTLHLLIFFLLTAIGGPFSITKIPVYFGIQQRTEPRYYDPSSILASTANTFFTT